MNAYDIDTAVTVTCTFRDVNGAPIDPLVVNLFIAGPGQATQTIPQSGLTHPSTGVFSYLVSANASGVWVYQFQGSGNIQVTSAEARFKVRSSSLIPG